MRTVWKVRDGDASLIIDGRYFPLTIYIWHGVTQTLAELQYQARSDFDALAQREGAKIIVVNDLTKFGIPDSSIRKSIADGAAKLERSPACFQYVTVVPSALVRGAVTAMNWLVRSQGNVIENTNVADLRNGLKVALAAYETIGVKIHGLEPSTYEVPKSVTTSAADVREMTFGE